MSLNLNDDDRNIIKLRGLPWNSTAKDIMDFLKECQTSEGEKSVHLAISHRDGRPNGEAFVELATPGDVDKAFEYNKNVLGHRYIEIFNAKPEEFEMCLKRQNLVQQDTFIKLRGLPFSCKSEDIEQFFQGLEIRNGGNGIYIVFDSRGRPTGEAFVQFCNSEDTDLAMKKNREKIGQRYIEIFRSSSSECRRSTIFNNNGGGNGGGNNNSNNGGNNDAPWRNNNSNNDRMGRGQRNNRTNFRDRPYPDTPWSGNNNNNSNNGGSNNDAPWRNNNRGNNNFGGNSGGGGGGGFNDNFGGSNSGTNNNNNSFNNDSNSNNFSSEDFERNWNSGGNNSFSSFGGGGGGGGNNNSNNNKSGGGGGGGGGFNRDNNFGFNSFSSNNSNSSGGNGGNFGANNDRFMGNSGGNNMGNNGGGGGGSQYAVHLRGMPYDCGEMEVQQFFAPLKLVNVQILYNNNGRHTGEADAYFTTIADAQEAMKKHKEKMGSRYIELFAKSNERRGGGGGNGGGRF